MRDIITNHEQCHLKGQCPCFEVCPMVVFHKIVAGKWKLMILWYLSNDNLRFSDLKRKLPEATQKMLTQQLRSLEEDKLIFRKVYPVVPPKVEYGLTEIGKHIVPVLQQMYSYGIEYINKSAE